MSIDFKFLVESPDDLYNPGDEPLCFGLIRDRWVYKKGMETHQGMMNEIRLQVEGEVPENHFAWTIFPTFRSMQEENSWWESLQDVEDLFWAAKRGDERALRAFFGLSGRLSTVKPKFVNDQLCAFWEETAVVRQHLSELHQFFKHLGLDITKYKFDTLDGVKDKNELGYFSYKALVGNQQFAPARSPEEQQRLLQIQHIDPRAKKALGNISVVGSSKYAKKASNAGFPNTASFMNFVTQESTLKEEFEHYLDRYNAWINPAGKVYMLDQMSHDGWANNHLGYKTSADNDHYGDAAEKLHQLGWGRVVRAPGRYLYVDILPNGRQLKELEDLCIEQELKLIDGHSNVIFDGQRSVEESTHLTEEIDDWAHFKNNDAWMTKDAKLKKLPAGEVHHKWAYDFLVKKKLFKPIPGWLEDDDWEIRKKAWDNAASILYKRGWQRVVRFPGKLLFAGTQPPTDKQLTELKNIAIEEQRVLFDDDNNILYKPDKVKQHLRIIPQKLPDKPATMTTAQYNFMRGESANQLNEKTAPTFKITTWKALPDDWKTQYPEELFGFKPSYVYPIAMGITLDGYVEAKKLKYRYRYYGQHHANWNLPVQLKEPLLDFKNWVLNTNNVVTWRDIHNPPSKVDMDAVDSYLALKGIKVFSHGTQPYFAPFSYEDESPINYRNPDYYKTMGRQAHQLKTISGISQQAGILKSTPTMAQWYYAHGESVIKEDPDDIWINSIDPSDQVSFVVLVKENQPVLVYSRISPMDDGHVAAPADTHVGIKTALTNAHELISEMPHLQTSDYYYSDYFEDLYEELSDEEPLDPFGDFSEITSKGIRLEASNMRTIHFVGRKILTLRDLNNFLRQYSKIIKNSNDMRCGDAWVGGRFSLDKTNPLASFWCTFEDTITKHKAMPLVFEMLKEFGRTPEKCIYEFIDTEILNFDQLQPEEAPQPIRSKEEIMKLMQKQHIDPKAKRQLFGNIDVGGSTKKAQQAYNAGFPNTASFSNFVSQESSQLNEKTKPVSKIPTFSSWSRMPADWKAQYPIRFFGYHNINVFPVVMGLAYDGVIEAKKIPEKYKYHSHDDTSWTLPKELNKDLEYDFHWWVLANNNVVSWSIYGKKPTQVDMNAVDSYLLQRGIKVFSHGHGYFIGPNNHAGFYKNAGLMYRTPDYYKKHGRKIIPTATWPGKEPVGRQLTLKLPPAKQDVTQAQWHYAHGESTQLDEKITIPTITTWARLPDDWKKQFPKKFFGSYNSNIQSIVIGIALGDNVEAKKLPPLYQFYEQHDTKWNLVTQLKKPLYKFKFWKLGNHSVVRWDSDILPTKREMDAVDSYLLQKGIKVVSHGYSYFLGSNSYTDREEAAGAVLYRTPDYYKKHGRQITPPQETSISKTKAPAVDTTMAQWHYAHGESTAPSFQDFCESSMTAGSGGAFGILSTPYADGDARVPFALGAIQTRPGMGIRRKKRRKRKHK